MRDKSNSILTATVFLRHPKQGLMFGEGGGRGSRKLSLTATVLVVVLMAKWLLDLVPSRLAKLMNHDIC